MISETFVNMDEEEKLNAIYNSVIGWIKSEFLTEIIERFLELHRAEFFRSSAAGRHHHAYEGGLLDHSFEVFMLSSQIGELYPEINKDILYAGAFLHDIGKMHTYDQYILKSGKPSKATPYKRNEFSKIQGHFGEGLEIISNIVKDMENEGKVIHPTELIGIKHIIASHHGPISMRWGSLVDPDTPEAWIVHLSDMISSRVGGDDPNTSKEV